MQRIVVATDFSERSALAVRRAAQLATQRSATLDIVHVVDADLPPRMIHSVLETARESLDELASTLQNKHGVNCTRQAVCADEAFVGVLNTARDVSADLIVIGAHRRRILRDIFVGTTAERIVRNSAIPALMVNAEPAAPYERTLIAVDLSDASRAALRGAQSLGLTTHTRCVVLHAFATPATHLMTRTGVEMDKVRDHLEQERKRAQDDLRIFLNMLDLNALEHAVTPLHESPAAAIDHAARAAQADLIVVASHGRGGLQKVLLGSVTQELLRLSAVDVLVTPFVDSAAR